MIDFVFEELKAVGAVRSGTDFSEQWLGMQEACHRSLRSKKRQASAKAVAACAKKLKTTAGVLSQSKRPEARVIAAQYERLADQCVDFLLGDYQRGGSHAD